MHNQSEATRSSELRVSKHQHHHCTEHHFMLRKVFFIFIFCQMVSLGSLRHLSSLTHCCWPVELQHGHSPSVMKSPSQNTYLSRNTSHKVSFSCHCYIYLTYSRTVWMHTDNLLKCYDHRFTDTVKENEKMSFWIAQKSKLNKLNVRRCFCSDS